MNNAPSYGLQVSYWCFVQWLFDFADAVSVFSDDLAITIPDERFDEERFVTIGVDVFGRVLVVVYTMRGDEIRFISARKATRQERQQYEEG